LNIQIVKRDSDLKHDMQVLHRRGYCLYHSAHSQWEVYFRNTHCRSKGTLWLQSL